jgi:hypothetical protein
MLITNYIILMHLLSQKQINICGLLCSSILQRLQHIFKNASLCFDTLVRTLLYVGLHCYL